MSIGKARAAREVLRGMAARVQALQTTHVNTRANIAAQYGLPPSRKQELHNVAREQSQSNLAALEREFKEALEVYRAELHEARRRPQSMDVDEQMAWRRLEMQLDAAKADPNRHAGDVARQRIDQAVREGDRAMLRAARAMLPDYLAGAQPGDDVVVPELLRFLDIQAGGEIAEATALEAEIKNGELWLQGAINAVRAEISGSIESAVVIPTWDGSTIPLAEVPSYRQIEAAATREVVVAMREAGYMPSHDGGLSQSNPAPAPVPAAAE